MGIGVDDRDTTSFRTGKYKNPTTVTPQDAKPLENTTNRLIKDINIDMDVGNSEVISTHYIPVDAKSTPPPVTSTEQRGVWCYCNFPECVPSGYMCQSEVGVGCFSKLSEQALSNSHGRLYRHLAVDSLTRGCIELLTKDERHYCEMKQQETKERNIALRTQHGEHQHHHHLRCCHQNMCNYEMSKPIIVREIEESEVILSPDKEWFRGITIGVSVIGIMILIFLFVFAGRILTSEEKGRSSEFLNEHPARDLYIKVPFYIERTPDASSSGGGGGGGDVCSVLCVKSLQKSLLQKRQQDVADYCRFHPLASSNRHSFSCPSSLAIFPSTEEEREELQPLKRDESLLLVHVDKVKERPGQVTCQESL